MAEPITVDELISEIERLQGSNVDSAGWLTTNELMEKWGVGDTKARKLLRAASKNGLLRASRKHVTGYDGNRHLVTCYQFDLPKKSRKDK